MERLVPWAQPLVDLRTGDPAGVELLARLEVPGHGVLEPAEFVGTVVPEVAVDRRMWWYARRLVTAMPGLRVHVNLSAATLCDGRVLRRMLRAGPEVVSRVVVEITERLPPDSVEAALLAAESLRDAGYVLALDDFGVGTSSLRALRRLCPCVLKLDGSFVRGVALDARARAVVRAVAGLCRDLGCTLVAEGVETPGLLEPLRDLGVDCAQGFAISPPVPIPLACHPRDIALLPPLPQNGTGGTLKKT